MNAFEIGTIEKIASYISESARDERKIERHGKRGYRAEKKRLAAKGATQGTWTGGITGGLGGAYLGAAAGKGKGALIGGALGAAGGAALGRMVGRSAGKQEARNREDAHQFLKGKSKKEREKYFQQATQEKQKREELNARQEMARAMMMQAMDNRYDRYGGRRRY